MYYTGFIKKASKPYVINQSQQQYSMYFISKNFDVSKQQI